MNVVVVTGEMSTLCGGSCDGVQTPGLLVENFVMVTGAGVGQPQIGNTSPSLGGGTIRLG